MLRTLLCCSMLILASSWVYPHYQSGNDVGPQWAPVNSHVLQVGKDIGRFVEYDVSFNAPFENVPQVAIATTWLDWQMAAQIGYKVDLVQVSNKGFKVRMTALGTGAVYAVKISWLATDDPRVKVQYLESEEVGTLGAGEGNRNQEFNVPLGMEVASGDTPQAAAFLIGVNFANGKGEPQRLTVDLKEVSAEKGVTISLGTASNNVISFVKVCLFTSAYKSFAASAKLGARPVPSHAWTTGVGDRLEEAQMPYTSDLKTGDRGVLYGFTGYETRNAGVNTRMIIRPVLLGKNQISTKYGTWADSRPVEMNLQIVVYKPDTLKVFSNTCAEVFALCNFEGDTLKICDQNVDFRGSGFPGPVKSIWVPPGKAVQLYNRVGLEGKQSIVKDTAECLDGILFTLF